MRHLPFASLRFRLLLLVVLAVVPVLGLTVYTNLELRRLAAADAKAESLRLARLAASNQQDTIKDTRQLLFALAQLPAVAEGDPVTCSALFARLLNQYPQYTQLGVIAPDGTLFCSALPINEPVNLIPRDFFQHALQTRDFAIGTYQNDAISNKATLNMGYPVLDGTGELQAVVFAALDLTWLNQLAAQAELPEGSTFTVIDRNGTILVRYPDPGMWVGQSLPEAPIVETILSQKREGTAEAYGVDGIPRLFAFAPLSATPGGGDVYVSIGIPSSVAFVNANRLLARSLVALGLVTVLTLAAAWFGGHFFILRRVNVLLKVANQVGDGNLGARTGLPYGYGELSQLARAFDDMAGSLEKRIAERDQAEGALRESQRTLSTLMSNLPGMAYRCRNDWDRTMDFVSEGCFDLTGHSPSDLMGSRKVSFAQLVDPEDRRAVWNQVQAALERDTPFQLTYRIYTSSGEEKWVWEQGRGVISPDGSVMTLEGFIIDITERVLTHQILEQQVADRTRELTALYEVTAVASASLDLETVLERSLEQVLAVMEGELGAIHLLDEDRETLHLVAWRGIPGAGVAQFTSVPVGSGLMGWVIEQGEALVIPDIATSPRPLLAIPSQECQAYVGAPIRARGQMLGVLSVVSEVGRQFDQEEVALLDSIADQVGVAVENARLYDAEQTRRRQADTLLDVVSIVGSTLELDEVLSRILDQLQRVVGYDSASVQLLQGDDLQVVAGRGLPDVQQMLGLTFPLGEEFPNQKVIREKQALSLADAPALYPAFRLPPYNHIRSWLGVPLHVQERIIGMITLDRGQPGGYGEEEVRLASAFADQVALALENARLYRQAEQLAVMKERSRLARELHDSVTQALYSISLLTEAAGRLTRTGELGRVEKHLARLGETALQALKEMRLLVHELRPPVLEKEGLVGALQQRLDAVEGRSGVETRLRVDGTLELPALMEQELYRITQEALNNALKHAAATLVTVQIRASGQQVELEIADNGIGFDPEAVADLGGMGLLGMRERVDRLGGSLTIVSTPGEGTRVKISMETNGAVTNLSRSLIGSLGYPGVFR